MIEEPSSGTIRKDVGVNSGHAVAIELVDGVKILDIFRQCGAACKFKAVLVERSRLPIRFCVIESFPFLLDITIRADIEHLTLSRIFNLSAKGLVYEMCVPFVRNHSCK